MRGAFRDKFAFELFIEKIWNAIQSCITELVTGTWLEFFVLDPVGQYVVVAAIALILSLCVGRFHIIADIWRIMADKALACLQGNNAKGGGDVARDNDDPGAAGDKDSANDVRNKQQAAKLAARLRNLHIPTPKKASSLASHVQSQRDHSVLVESVENAGSLLKHQTPSRRTFQITTEGDPETIRKRKEQLDRLRMWS
ncbi:hypothetical protein PMIN06_002635 [Paraphaeosphaeria minitans]